MPAFPPRETTANIGDDGADHHCRLFVNGGEITSENCVKLHEDYADLPFTAVLKALGAEVEWKSKAEARVTFNGKEYTLDTENYSFVEMGESDNLILPPPGGFGYYQVVGGELVLDDGTMKGAFQLMGTSIKVNVYYDDRTIKIE